VLQSAVCVQLCLEREGLLTEFSSSTAVMAAMSLAITPFRNIVDSETAVMARPGCV